MFPKPVRVGRANQQAPRRQMYTVYGILDDNQSRRVDIVYSIPDRACFCAGLPIHTRKGTDVCPPEALLVFPYTVYRISDRFSGVSQFAQVQRDTKNTWKNAFFPVFSIFAKARQRLGEMLAVSRIQYTKPTLDAPGVGSTPAKRGTRARPTPWRKLFFGGTSTQP